MKKLKDAKAFLSNPASETKHTIAGKVIKVAQKIDKQSQYSALILKKIKTNLKQITSDCHQQTLGSMLKSERKALKTCVKNTLQNMQFDEQLKNKFFNQNQLTRVTENIATLITRSIFQLLSYKENNEYTILKRLALKESGLKISTKIISLVHEACDNFLQSTNAKELPEIDRLDFNFDAERQITFLLELIVNHQDQKEKHSLFIAEITHLIRKFPGLELRKTLKNNIYKACGDEKLSEDILSDINISLKKKKHLWKSSETQDKTLLKATLHKTERTLPTQDFILKNQKKINLDSMISLSENRKVYQYEIDHRLFYLKPADNKDSKHSLIVEYASFLLSDLLIGHGIPPSDLFYLNDKLVLTSKMIKTPISDEEAKNCHLEAKMDSGSLTEFFILMLVLSPGDVRHANCGYEKLSNDEFRISCFDNEDNFKDDRLLFSRDEKLNTIKNVISATGSQMGFKRNQFAYPTTNTNCFIFGLKEMQNPVDQTAISRFMTKNPEKIVSRWLQLMENKLNELGLKTHPFNREKINQTLNRMGALKLILEHTFKNSSRMTYNDILKHFSQNLAASYYRNPASSFRGKSTSVVSRNTESDIAGLKQTITHLQTISAEYDSNQHIPGHEEFDLEKFNELSAHLQAFCLTKANFYINNLEGETRETAEERLIDQLAKITFKRLYSLRLNGIQKLTTEKLKKILTNIGSQTEKLTHIDLSNSNITDNDLPNIALACNNLQVEKLNLSRTQISNLVSKSSFTLYLTSGALLLKTITKLYLNECKQLSQLNLTVPCLIVLRANRCKKLHKFQVSTNNKKATSELSDCDELLKPNTQNWVSAIQLNLRLARFGAMDISDHCLNLAELIFQKTYKYNHQYYVLQNNLPINEQMIFGCLNILPENFYLQLQERMQDIVVKKDITEEILQYLMTNKLHFLDDDTQKAWDALHQQQEDAEKVERKSENRLINFCENDEIHHQYFQHLKKNNKLTLQTLTAFLSADKSRNVIIYEFASAENQLNSLSLFAEHSADKEPNDLTLSNKESFVCNFVDKKNFDTLILAFDAKINTFIPLLNADLRIKFNHHLNPDDLRLLQLLFQSKKITQPIIFEIDLGFISNQSLDDIRFIKTLIAHAPNLSKYLVSQNNKKTPKSQVDILCELDLFLQKLSMPKNDFNLIIPVTKQSQLNTNTQPQENPSLNQDIPITDPKDERVANLKKKNQDQKQTIGDLTVTVQSQDNTIADLNADLANNKQTIITQEKKLNYATKHAEKIKIASTQGVQQFEKHQKTAAWPFWSTRNDLRNDGWRDTNKTVAELATNIESTIGKPKT